MTAPMSNFPKELNPEVSEKGLQVVYTTVGWLKARNVSESVDFNLVRYQF